LCRVSLDVVHDGRIKVPDLDGLKVAVASALRNAPYDGFWAAVSQGDDLDAVLVSSFSLGKLTAGTVEWRRKILINWGKAVGLIPRRQVRRAKLSGSPLLFS
jgi:hypothetical protein